MFFIIFISYFDEISLSKQNSLRWDAAFCSVTSGAILFAYVQQIGHNAYISLDLFMLDNNDFETIWKY